MITPLSMCSFSLSLPLALSFHPSPPLILDRVFTTSLQHPPPLTHSQHIVFHNYLHPLPFPRPSPAPTTLSQPFVLCSFEHRRGITHPHIPHHTTKNSTHWVHQRAETLTLSHSSLSHHILLKKLPAHPTPPHPAGCKHSVFHSFSPPPPPLTLPSTPLPALHPLPT